MKKMSYTYDMETVSRTEIADCIEQAFAGAPVSSAELVAYASDHGARKRVLEVLGRLDAGVYRDLRDLWGELGDVPVEG
jgi:hypothetical protein